MLELEECTYTFGRDQNKEMSLEITKPIQTTLSTQSSMFSHIDGMCMIYCEKLVVVKRIKDFLSFAHAQ